MSGVLVHANVMQLSSELVRAEFSSVVDAQRTLSATITRGHDWSSVLEDVTQHPVRRLHLHQLHRKSNLAVEQLHIVSSMWQAQPLYSNSVRAKVLCKGIPHCFAEQGMSVETVLRAVLLVDMFLVQRAVVSQSVTLSDIVTSAFSLPSTLCDEDTIAVEIDGRNLYYADLALEILHSTRCNVWRPTAYDFINFLEKVLGTDPIMSSHESTSTSPSLSHSTQLTNRLLLVALHPELMWCFDQCIIGCAIFLIAHGHIHVTHPDVDVVWRKCLGRVDSTESLSACIMLLIACMKLFPCTNVTDPHRTSYSLNLALISPTLCSTSPLIRWSHAVCDIV